MAAQVANVIVLIVAVYAVIGLIVGAAFVSVGVSRVDHAATGAPWSFRLILLPGAAALWPMALRMWRRSRREAAP